MWPMLIAAGAGALLNAQKQKAQQQAEANAMEANAEAIRYSPWTKMNPGMMQGSGGSQTAALAEGALSGAMFGSQFGGGGGMGAIMGAPASAGPSGGGGTPWSGLNQNYYKKPNLYNTQPGQSSGFALA